MFSLPLPEQDLEQDSNSVEIKIEEKYKEFYGSLPVDFIGYDMVEVMPSYDPAQITSLLAANIMYEFISLIALSKKTGTSSSNI